MQFQFRAGDHGASTYVPPTPSVPRGTAPSLIGELWSAGEGMGSECRAAAELIATQTVMRREIEGRLRRELMMERESLILRGGSGLLFFQPLAIVVQPPGLERLNTMDGGLHCAPLPGFQDSTILAPMGGGHRNLTFTAPLQNGGVPPVAMSVGIKRKADEAANGELTLSSSKMNRTDKKWICTLCQASSTCEQGLQNHFQGKKHKAKEAALKKSAEKTQICKPHPLPGGDEGKSQLKPHHLPRGDEGKSLLKDEQGTSLWCPVCEISTNSQAIMESHLRGKKHLAKLRKKSRTPSPNDTREVREMTGAEEEDVSSSKAERAEEDANEGGEKQLAVNRRQAHQKFWCEACKIGATSEELMKEHRTGKKHMALLRKNGGALIVQTYGEATLPEEKKETQVEEEDGRDKRHQIS